MPILFCNIGWMDKYNGILGDSIKNGGRYNKHAVGHEVCNFTNNKGTVYGYVQPVGDSIKIERLGASKGDKKINGVTVVWTASPETGGTVVVGWYEDAIVFRDLQPIEEPHVRQKKSGVASYRVSAPFNKATLLPIEQRELIIPRAVKGGIGKSNVWFADKAESQKIVSQVWDFIKTRSIPTLPDVDQIESIQEGNPRLIAHLRRERSAAIVKSKKVAVLKSTGELACEACGFNFKHVYGDLGDGFCEVHHIRPLSQSDGVVETELKDLAIVCSNCHRIIHRSHPMPSIKDLAKRLKKSRV